MDGGGADSRPPARSRIVYAARRAPWAGDANFSSCRESYRRSVNDFTLVPVTRRSPLPLPLSPDRVSPHSRESEAASRLFSLVRPPPLPSARRKIRSPAGGETALAGRPPRHSAPLRSRREREKESRRFSKVFLFLARGHVDTLFERACRDH